MTQYTSAIDKETDERTNRIIYSTVYTALCIATCGKK